jgi:hypothetical protein
VYDINVSWSSSIDICTRVWQSCLYYSVSSHKHKLSSLTWSLHLVLLSMSNTHPCHCIRNSTNILCSVSAAGVSTDNFYVLYNSFFCSRIIFLAIW